MNNADSQDSEKLSLNDWPAFNKECTDYFEKKCKEIIAKEALFMTRDKNFTFGIIVPESLSIPIENLIMLTERILLFKAIFKTTYPESVPEAAKQLYEEITLTEANCLLNLVKISKIHADNFINYLKIPNSLKKIINNKTKLPSQAEMYPLIYDTSTWGWLALQNNRYLFLKYIFPANEAEGIRFCAQLSQLFAAQQLELYTHFQLRFINTPDLKKAQQAAETKICDEAYKTVIKKQKDMCTSYKWQFEHAQNLFQRSFRFLKNELTASNIDTLLDMLDRTVSCFSSIAFTFNALSHEQREENITLLSNFFNCMLFFLSQINSEHVKRWNLKQREIMLNLLKRMVNSNLVIAEVDPLLQASIEDHKNIIDREIAQFDNEKALLLSKIEEQRLLLEHKNEIENDYQAHFTQLLAAFENEPETGRRKNGTRQLPATEETDQEDDDDYQSDTEERETETIENIKFLQVHLVTFQDQPEQRKKQTFFNGPWLTKALNDAKLENNPLAISQLAFTLADFHRLQAFKEIQSGVMNLIEANNHFIDAIKYLYEAVHTINSLEPNNDNNEEFLDTHRWANLVLGETEKLLQRCQDKMDRHIQMLEKSRDQAKEYMIKKWGKHSWFKSKEINWNNLSEKSQQSIILIEDKKRLMAIEKHFNQTKTLYVDGQKKVNKKKDKPAKTSPVNEPSSTVNLSSNSAGFFNEESKRHKGRRKRRGKGKSTAQNSTSATIKI